MYGATSWRRGVLPQAWRARRQRTRGFTPPWGRSGAPVGPRCEAFSAKYRKIFSQSHGHERERCELAELPREFRRAEGSAVCLAQAGRPGVNAPTSLFRRAVSPAVCPGALVGSDLRRDACPCAAAPPGSRRSVREAYGNWPGLQPLAPRWVMLLPSPRGLGYANCRAYGPPKYARGVSAASTSWPLGLLASGVRRHATLEDARFA
jgi:hypothetical protein